jgi:hypothetical protein
MKNVLQKLQEARLIIDNSDLKKAGRNEYSKFDYYTPEQVESLVSVACSKTNTIVLCNLKADEFGLYQTLKFIDLDSLEEIDFEMRTKHGSITATNETQQMGGTDTYSERYIKMKVFEIKDNNLDIDSQDNRKPQLKAIPDTKKQRLEIMNLAENLKPMLRKDKLYKEFVLEVCGVELKEENFAFIIKTLKEQQ